MPDIQAEDPELAELLNEIDAANTQAEPAASAEEPLAPTPELPDPEEPARVLDLEVQTPPEEDLSLPFVDLARKFGNTVNTVLQNCDADRNQLQEVAQHMMQRVQNSDRPPSALVEAWVAAVSKKADVNIGVTKLLDSIAKLLAASKNNDLFSTVGEDGDGLDFDDLLAQDKHFDEIEDG